MRLTQRVRSLVSLASVVTLTVALTPSLSFAQAAPGKQAPAKPAAAAAAGAKGKAVEIKASDDMKYSLTTIEAKPGEQITVTLKPTGSMPKIAMSHNFVLLKAGSDAAAFANAAATSAPTYMPAAMQAQVIAASKLAGNGETVEVSFKAPAKAGSYPFLCTFPGHFQAGMKGTLVVK
jgi:azurin